MKAVNIALALVAALVVSLIRPRTAAASVGGDILPGSDSSPPAFSNADIGDFIGAFSSVPRDTPIPSPPPVLVSPSPDGAFFNNHEGGRGANAPSGGAGGGFAAIGAGLVGGVERGIGMVTGLVGINNFGTAGIRDGQTVGNQLGSFAAGIMGMFSGIGGIAAAAAGASNAMGGNDSGSSVGAGSPGDGAGRGGSDNSGNNGAGRGTSGNR